ncbi:hypothetical protein HOK00_11140 [bacterium]|nr:hypothetical protein [bacterium]
MNKEPFNKILEKMTTIEKIAKEISPDLMHCIIDLQSKNIEVNEKNIFIAQRLREHSYLSYWENIDKDLFEKSYIFLNLDRPIEELRKDSMFSVIPSYWSYHDNHLGRYIKNIQQLLRTFPNATKKEYIFFENNLYILNNDNCYQGWNQKEKDLPNIPLMMKLIKSHTKYFKDDLSKEETKLARHEKNSIISLVNSEIPFSKEAFQILNVYGIDYNPNFNTYVNTVKKFLPVALEYRTFLDRNITINDINKLHLYLNNKYKNLYNSNYTKILTLTNLELIEIETYYQKSLIKKKPNDSFIKKIIMFLTMKK